MNYETTYSANSFKVGMQEEPAEQPPWTIDTEIDSSLPQKKKREVKRMSDEDTSKLDPSSPKDRGRERERVQRVLKFLNPNNSCNVWGWIPMFSGSCYK